MGNRLRGVASAPRPRWVRVLLYAVGIALSVGAFYLAIRWSTDIGLGAWDD